jgi:hypothetical protein
MNANRALPSPLLFPYAKLVPVDVLDANTAVRLKVEENQLVDVFGEIGFHIDGLKGA